MSGTSHGPSSLVACSHPRAWALPARSQLFGQFLLEHGALQPDELSAALSLMAAINETIGDLAVARGWLSKAQADHIAELQRTIDAPWGDIATALQHGGLTPEQVEQLLWEQTEGNLRIGDALVETGAMSCSEVEDWMRRHESARLLDAVIAEDPEGVYDPVRHAVSGLSRVMLRRAGVHAACSMPLSWHRDPNRERGPQATATIEGGWSVSLGLALSPRLGCALGRRAGDGARAGAAVAVHLVEVLAGYVARRLDADGRRAPCRTDEGRAGPIEGTGLAFGIDSDFGPGVLVIDVRTPTPS